MEPPTIRELDAGDTRILTQATLDNLNWLGPRFTATDIEARPEFRHYTRLLPERGDFGFVHAGGHGEWVSVAWLLFLPADGPGFGFVRAGVPEVSVSTRAGQRGRGFGRNLLALALDEALRRGVEAVSLSVEAENPARRLYESLGFRSVVGAPEGTMLVELSAGASAPTRSNP